MWNDEFTEPYPHTNYFWKVTKQRETCDPFTFRTRHRMSEKAMARCLAKGEYVAAERIDRDSMVIESPAKAPTTPPGQAVAAIYPPRNGTGDSVGIDRPAGSLYNPDRDEGNS